jgi:predicted nucleic acid-binding protein
MINITPNNILRIFPISAKPRLYFDSCCFSRKYDIITHPLVEKEQQAIWVLQRFVEHRKVDLVWSYVLRVENKRIRDLKQRTEILAWEKCALISVEKSQEIYNISREVQAKGIHKFDALHIACAIVAHCQFFVTTDYRLQKYHDKRIYVCDPMECIEFL